MLQDTSKSKHPVKTLVITKAIMLPGNGKTCYYGMKTLSTLKKSSPISAGAQNSLFAKNDPTLNAYLANCLQDSDVTSVFYQVKCA